MTDATEFTSADVLHLARSLAAAKLDELLAHDRAMLAEDGCPAEEIEAARAELRERVTVRVDAYLVEVAAMLAEGQRRRLH